MQPANAAASASTGDGPAWLALSSVIDCCLTVVANFKSPIHVRSATVGALTAMPRFYRESACAARAGQCWATVRSGTGGVGSDAGGRATMDRVKNFDLIASHASGRPTSRYVSTWPNGLSGPHASVPW